MTVHTWSRTATENDDADITINWLEGMAPSLVNNSARATMAAIAKWRDDLKGNVATAGSSTAYTLTTFQGYPSLVDGRMVAFTPHVSNGVASTLNVDGLGAKPLRAKTGVSLPANVLLAGSPQLAVYRLSSDEWMVFGFIADEATGALSLAGGGTGTALTDPNADRIFFWDESANATAFLTAGSGLQITGTTLSTTTVVQEVPWNKLIAATARVFLS